MYYIFQLFAMKFLIAAACAFTVYSQSLVGSRDIRPPITSYEEPITTKTDLETGKEMPIQEVQRITNTFIQAKQEFNPVQLTIETIIDERKKQNKQAQILSPPSQPEMNSMGIPPGPMPGSQEFNPYQFVPEAPKREKGHKEYRGKKHEKRNKHEDKNEALANPLNYDQWQKHVEQGHKRGKFHRKLWIPLTIVAIIFTLVGVLLGKCIRKIKKCSKNKRRNVPDMPSNKNTAELYDEIKQKEERLNQLRAEYESKRASEQSGMELRNEETIWRDQVQIVRRIQPQQFRQVPPQMYYGQGAQIPVGRPLPQ